MDFPKPVRNLLASTLFSTAQRLIEIEQEIRSYLPNSLRHEVYIGGLHGQEPNAELVILITHGAAATRIRQTLPSLLLHLQSKGYGVANLRIKVQPHAIVVHEQNTTPEKHAVLGNIGIRCLQTLHTELSASPLRDALQQLISRHHR